MCNYICVHRKKFIEIVAKVSAFVQSQYPDKESAVNVTSTELAEGQYNQYTL